MGLNEEKEKTAKWFFCEVYSVSKDIKESSN